MCRVLVTVQRPDHAAEALAAVSARAASGDCVEVVGVPQALPVCAHWVGITGVAHCEDLRAELVDEACRLVHRTVATLPACVGVRHSVVPGWRDPRLLERLARGDVDELLLVAAPARRRDVRAVERAARAGGVTVVRREREPAAGPATAAEPVLSGAA